MRSVDKLSLGSGLILAVLATNINSEAHFHFTLTPSSIVHTRSSSYTHDYPPSHTIILLAMADMDFRNPDRIKLLTDLKEA